MFHARLPAGIMPQQLDFQELFQHDLQCVEKKMQMKAQAEGKKGMKTLEVQVGDAILVKKESSTKATPPFEREPLEVQHQKGTQVVTKTRDGCTITQSMADFMMVPYQTSEEAGRWKLRPCARQEELPKPSGDPTEIPRMKEPQEVQILEFDTRILTELGTRPQSAQQSYLRHALPQEARGHNGRISQEQISRAWVTRQFPVTKYLLFLRNLRCLTQ